ncbi:hypothetical protein CW304_29220 [Bacillus sp. UFRGS-B20]|nr:hypothetical protein CW304_29220 [Bacillus sp. UFRGS-B20]
MNIRAFSPNLRLLFFYIIPYTSLSFEEFHIAIPFFLSRFVTLPRVFVNKDRFFLYLQSYHSMNFSFFSRAFSFCLIKQFRIY